MQVRLECRAPATAGRARPGRTAPPLPTEEVETRDKGPLVTQLKISANQIPCPPCPKGQKRARQIPTEQTSTSHVLRAYRLCLVTSQPETSMSSEVSEECCLGKAERPDLPLAALHSLALGFLLSAAQRHRVGDWRGDFQNLNLPASHAFQM